MKLPRMIPAAFAGAALALPLGASAAEAPIALSADDKSVRWGPCPDLFPKGCQIAVLRGDPSKPNADVLLRVPAGYEIPAHSHTSAERMILVSGRLKVKYSGAPETTLTPGMYAFGPAGLAHKANCEGDQACTLFIAFEAPVDALAHMGPLN